MDEHIRYIHLNTHAHVYIPQLITARLTGAHVLFMCLHDHGTNNSC